MTSIVSNMHVLINRPFSIQVSMLHFAAAYLYKRIRKVALEIAVPKARRSTTKVRVLNRRPSSLRHTLPRNSQLLASLRITRNKLVINRPDANIPDLRASSRKRW